MMYHSTQLMIPIKKIHPLCTKNKRFTHLTPKEIRIHCWWVLKHFTLSSSLYLACHSNPVLFSPSSYKIQHCCTPVFSIIKWFLLTTERFDDGEKITAMINQTQCSNHAQTPRATWAIYYDNFFKWKYKAYLLNYTLHKLWLDHKLQLASQYFTQINIH